MKKLLLGLFVVLSVGCGGGGGGGPALTGNGGNGGGNGNGGGGGIVAPNPRAGSYVGTAARSFSGPTGWVPASGGMKSALGLIASTGAATFTILDDDGQGHNETIVGTVAADGTFQGDVTYWAVGGFYRTTPVSSSQFSAPFTWQVEHNAGGSTGRIFLEMVKQ